MVKLPADLSQNLNRATQELGMSPRESQKVRLALSNIIVIGMIDDVSLRNELAEALPPAIELAQKALGVDGARFDTLLKSGVKASQFIPRFSIALANAYGPTRTLPHPY